MNDFKLKLILSILSGIVFAFIFILLAFALPIKKHDVIILPKTILEKVAHSAKK